MNVRMHAAIAQFRPHVKLKDMKRDRMYLRTQTFKIQSASRVETALRYQHFLKLSYFLLLSPQGLNQEVQGHLKRNPKGTTSQPCETWHHPPFAHQAALSTA